MLFRFVPLTTALAVFLQSSLVNAETIKLHQCARDKLIRTVELQVDNESGVPCRVLYHRAMEGKPTANLWNASKDAQFCSSKYEAFIVKLESKLNWSCEIIEGTVQPLAEKALPPQSITIEPGTLKAATNTGLKSTETNSVSANRAVSPSGNELPQGKQLPDLAQSLPDSRTTRKADIALSMNLIRQYFPSGRYAAYEADALGENASLCPSGGFFVWNTRSPDKPVFEMGADVEFQFDLASVSELPVASVTQGALINQCQPATSAGYCSAEKYTGKSPLHPSLSAYYGCGDSSENSRLSRPLVLTRSLINTNSDTSECAISENYHYMALAPALASGTAPGVTQKHDIELVILPGQSASGSLNTSKGTLCRYVLGG